MEQADGGDTSYWVWQQTTPLPARDLSELKAASVTELYWHVGTVNWQVSTWHWREYLALDWPAIRSSCPGIEITPVVRIEAGSGATFPPESRAPLRKLLEGVLADSAAHSLQIDYESPDRLLDEYVDFLRQLKDQGRSWQLSISALAHWSKFGGKLAGCADEITPMFYDLDPKSERLATEGMPSLVGKDLASQVDSWRGFPIGWKAGLPNFSRVTVLAPDGKNRGNLRGWAWDEVIFAPFLQAAGPTTGGQALFTVRRDSLLGYTPLHAQEHLDIRYPDRAQLRQAVLESTAAGATGVIYFRLSNATDSSGYSVPDLSVEQDQAASLKLKKDSSGRFVLSNSGTSDLMPVVCGARADDHGYALELEAQAPIWREAIAGDFAKATTVTGQGQGEALGTSRLQFWFAHLAAGDTLTSGYIDEIEHAKSVSIRWRIRNLLKEDSWHSLE